MSEIKRPSSREMARVYQCAPRVSQYIKELEDHINHRQHTQWVKHDGGACPIENGTFVLVLYSGDMGIFFDNDIAEQVTWSLVQQYTIIDPPQED